jgi:hypothetical protein
LTASGSMSREGGPRRHARTCSGHPRRRAINDVCLFLPPFMQSLVEILQTMLTADDVDGRDKPGQDGEGAALRSAA